MTTLLIKHTQFFCGLQTRRPWSVKIGSLGQISVGANTA